MVFNTDQDEYVGDLTEGAGIRVVVHNQTDMPFPEDKSIAVSPGTLTYIGASLVSDALYPFILNEAAWSINIRHRGQMTDRNAQNIYKVYTIKRSKNDVTPNAKSSCHANAQQCDLYKNYTPT